MSSAYLPALWLFMDYFTFATTFVSVVLYGLHGLFGWNAIVATFKQVWDHVLILGWTSTISCSIKHTLNRSTSTMTYRTIWPLHLPQNLNEGRRLSEDVGSMIIFFFHDSDMPECQILTQFYAHLIEPLSNQTNLYDPRLPDTSPLWSINRLPPSRRTSRQPCPPGEKSELLGLGILSKQRSQIKIEMGGEIWHMFEWVSSYFKKNRSLTSCDVAFCSMKSRLKMAMENYPERSSTGSWSLFLNVQSQITSFWGEICGEQQYS